MRQQLPQSDRLTPVEEQARSHAWSLPIWNNGHFTNDLFWNHRFVILHKTCWQDKCLAGGGIWVVLAGHVLDVLDLLPKLEAYTTQVFLWKKYGNPVETTNLTSIRSNRGGWQSTKTVFCILAWDKLVVFLAHLKKHSNTQSWSFLVYQNCIKSLWAPKPYRKADFPAQPKCSVMHWWRCQTRWKSQ